MKIFIDFDDVLFNTKSFIFDYRKIFVKNGVPEEIFEKYYKDKSAKGDLRVKKHNPREQVEKIKKLGYETSGIEREMSELLKNTGSYLFKDSQKFVEKFKDEDLYIVSFGDKKFQKEKIVNSGISHYFKKIVIADVSKAVGIKNILKNKKTEMGEPLIFIDDRVKFLEDIKKTYPGMITILMQRAEGRFFDERNESCNFTAENFSQVLDIIKK